jgi:cytoskeletal protein RodZ
MRDKFYEVQHLGTLLKRRRTDLGISLKQVAEATKIRIEHLEAIEEGEFDKLPADVYTKGFIRNYSQYLELDPEKALALYRRENRIIPSSTTIKKTKSVKRKGINIRITPERLVLVSLFLGFFLIIIYIVSRVSSVIQAPEFEVTYPIPISAGSSQIYTTDLEKISIKGKLEVGSTLKINGSEFDTKNLEIFEITDLKLNPGDNIFELTAESPFGITSKIELKAIKETSTKSNTPEEVTTTPTEQSTSMLVEIMVGPRDANIFLVIDGVETENWVETAGTVKTFRAQNSVKLQTPRPDSVRIAINSQEMTLDTSDTKEWIILDGKVIEKQ